MIRLQARANRGRAVLACAAVLFACGSEGPAGPAPPSSARRFSEISAGYYHTCALTPTGTAFCWGANDFGTLGDGTRAQRSEPTPVAGALRLAALDAGAGHNCALTESGDAWCWGQNDEGQLGDGTFSVRDEPVPVNGGVAFMSISAGHAHSCGITEDGTAYCWGDDSRGQLGNGADGSVKSAVPVAVQHVGPFSRVFAGYYQTCGIDTAGGAWCWGANESGQLGDGTDADSDVPVAVAGGHLFGDLAPGDRFVCGVSGSETWCWGANRAGELGSSGDPQGSAVPVRIDGGQPTSLVTLSMGPSTIPAAAPYACILRNTDQAACWGGAIPPLRDAGAQVTLLDGRIRFQSIAAGAQHVCGLSRDRYAYCGGANYAGQLGDGTRTDRAPMVPVH